MIGRRHARPGLVLVLVGLPGACRTPEGPPYFEIVASRPPARTLSATELWPSREGEQTFLIVKGAEVTGEIVRRQGPADRFSADWVVVEPEVREQFYAIDGDGDGDIVLRAVIEHGDRAISLFSPPLLSMPAVLEPGAPRTTDVAMRVVHRDDPRRERERGRAVQTVEYAADCRVRIGEDEFEVARIELILEADLRLADVRRVASMFIIPGQGLIAEQYEQTTRILGLATTMERRVMVIAPPPAPPPSVVVRP